MGSPRQTFAGETRLTRQCRWPRAAEGRSASHFKIYPSLLEQPRPCLSPQARRRRRRRRRRTQRSWDSLLPPRNISGPTPNPNPNAFPSVVDLSAAVFRYEPFKKTETFQEGDEDLKPSFPFWRAESASSQLVFKLSLVKTISPVPQCPQLSKEEREGTFKEVWEASRLTLGRLFIFLHKTHWVFLTHNSCAMMHKRQLWSKFKIKKCKICRGQDQSAIGLYHYPTLHILSSIPGGSTNQC